MLLLKGLTGFLKYIMELRILLRLGPVDEAEANAGVKELSEAVKADDDVDVSKALVRLSTFVKQLHDAGSRLINE